jgi:hypothetical protein
MLSKLQIDSCSRSPRELKRWSKKLKDEEKSSSEHPAFVSNFPSLSPSLNFASPYIATMFPLECQLSAAKYGYDFVVATTQASINATMKNFLAKHTQPTVTVCYVAGARGNPVEIPYQVLMKNAQGADPFAVPKDADAANDPNVIKLLNARFISGFRVTLGLPKKVDPTKYNIVELGANAASVKYNMTCSEFIVVNLDSGTAFSPKRKWFWDSQDEDPSGLWQFTSTVDLRLTTLGEEKYKDLPAHMQSSINNLSGITFSV